MTGLTIKAEPDNQSPNFVWHYYQIQPIQQCFHTLYIKPAVLVAVTTSCLLLAWCVKREDNYSKYILVLEIFLFSREFLSVWINNTGLTHDTWKWPPSFVSITLGYQSKPFFYGFENYPKFCVTHENYGLIMSSCFHTFAIFV